MVTLLLLSSTVFAVEIAELSNGFSIRHRTHEMRNGLVRLYIDDQKSSFVDIPADQIVSYAFEPDPLPSPRSSEPAKNTGQIVREASASSSKRARVMRLRFRLRAHAG
jgi:hypothetical protein